MTQSAGFFKALFGSCSGRDVFYTLRRHSWPRCLWHLFVLCFITGAIIGHVQHNRLQGVINGFEAVFTEIFGKEIYVSESRSSWNWIAPVQDPLKPREMAIPGGGRFYYTGTSTKVPESLKLVSGPAVVWSPDRLGIAVPAGSAGGNCMIIDTLSGKVSQFQGTASSLEELFKKSPQKLPLPAEKMKKENISDFFTVLSMLFSTFATAAQIIWHFFITLLYTGIFIGMYRLLNGPTGRLRFLTLKEMWKCGIYAAFPVMIIASFFPILELPFFTYETVFMIGLLLYWMAVTAKLERTPTDDEVNNAPQNE